jgi:outer membrane protein
MKKIYFAVFILALFFGLNSSAFPQTKVGYVDSKKVVESMQESRDAKTRLDNLVSQWQTELTGLQDSLKALKDDYEKKKLILTDQLKTQLEGNIQGLETSINTFKVQKFGENGEYFQKQAEFMKPLQDRVFAAIEKVAKEEDYDYILDKSGDILILYFNERYDITSKVMTEISGR